MIPRYTSQHIALRLDRAAMVFTKYCRSVRYGVSRQDTSHERPLDPTARHPVNSRDAPTPVPMPPGQEDAEKRRT